MRDASVSWVEASGALVVLVVHVLTSREFEKPIGSHVIRFGPCSTSTPIR